MKKFIILIGVFLLFSYIANAQVADNIVSKTSDGVSTVYNDLKSTAPAVSKALNSLAKELKVGVNAVWDILVKQQLVWSWCFLILTLSALINWFMFYRRNFFKIKDDGDYIICKRWAPSKERNPQYYEHARNGDARSHYYLLQEEEYPAPKVVNNLSWFKYVHLAICIVLSIYSFIHFSDMMTGFINPEYGAMKTIATIAQQIK